jgi:alpha-L-rhamnosidase
MGATTIWERWDSMLPDGSVNPSGMTSFNHYALGAVADWMHRSVAGLAPAAPGYREISVCPHPTAALTEASARHVTPFGEAAVAWNRSDGHFELRVSVPVGTVAHVQLPGAPQPESVGHGEHAWRIPDPCGDPVDRGLATVRDLLDDRPTWAAVAAAAVETGVLPEGEAQAAQRLAAYFEAPAAVAARALAPGPWVPGAVDLGRRVSEILAPRLR